MRIPHSNEHYLIDTTKPWHVAWWAAEFGVSEGELLAAVEIMGNRACMVEFHLHLIREAPGIDEPAEIEIPGTLSRRTSDDAIQRSS